MSNLLRGFYSGFIATIALTIIMMVKKVMGVMPELDPIHMMSTMISMKLGIIESPIIGWIMHFGVGTVAWGGAFAVFYHVLPTANKVSKGISLGIIAWVLMMIGPMPMSGAGFFGLNIGLGAPIMTLVLHIIFGVVLGLVFKPNEK
ncbi:hypothetical protein L0B53_03820 [Vibrio sp. SS-MA-C1-2]|uniref:DUF6789 family protein n=1 Tax=Vibrio sp. SS-MA-C1-2 TaxID=2908646 RepID=UPI001F1B2946|nr:DUF6789 family protein [Vibrio sp. SS-MA-C1-2]UJF17071.1 hypothetical protein L0B53_03820 [Vibrio sp. SS-MA-C1-2]